MPINQPPRTGSMVNESSDPCLRMVHAIQRVTPSLWSKVDVTHATLQEQRLKLIALLTWFANKNGWLTQSPVPQRYPDKGRHIAGRLAMELIKNNQSIRLEVAFDVPRTLALKLKAANTQGSRVLLLVESLDKKVEVAKHLDEPVAWLHLALLYPKV
jgi:hypothetical protein